MRNRTLVVRSSLDDVLGNIASPERDCGGGSPLGAYQIDVAFVAEALAPSSPECALKVGLWMWGVSDGGHTWFSPRVSMQHTLDEFDLPSPEQSLCRI